MRRLLHFLSAIAFTGLLAISGCNSRRKEGFPKVSNAPAAAAQIFTEVQTVSGGGPQASFWPDGQGFLPDLNPGGVALLDFDGDGRLDILQTCHAPPGNPTAPAPKRLYRQAADGSFALIPGAAGLEDHEFGQGVAVGDYDNDGHPDVYFCNYGQDHLFHNNGDGTFSDVTLKAGISGNRNFSTAAAFFDYDRDGWLDLIVVHYVKFDPSVVCTKDAQRIYCGPPDFPATRPTLYHNNHDGTFTDVTEKAGLTALGKSLGLVCADLTGDGWEDIFVCNDGENNHLWVNQRDGTFKEEAYLRGCAVNGVGRTEANMGVAVADLQNEGRLSIFITHQANEKNSLYSPDSNYIYRDASAETGMASIDFSYTGWGVGFFDPFNSGNLAVAVVNGRIRALPVTPGANCGPYWNAFAERNLLFQSDGAGRFQDVSDEAGDFTKHVEVTRGLAFGDVANDGRIALVTNTIDNRLRVFRNTLPPNGNHWLTLRAMTGRRDALGARITLIVGGRRLLRLALASYSAGCSNDPRVHFGLGRETAAEAEVVWPDAKAESFPIRDVDRFITLHEGQGEPLR